MIFIQRNSPFTDEKIIIEEDERSIWAYLLDKKNEILVDGFICATAPPVESKEEVKAAMEAGSAPPLLQDFQNQYSLQENLKKEEIQVLWISADEILIEIKGIAFLRMRKPSKTSYSLAVSKDGPYGKKWVIN